MIIALAACNASPSPLAAPAAVQPTWRHFPVAALPLNLRLPPGYSGSGYGAACWYAEPARLPGPGTRSICVELMSADEANSAYRDEIPITLFDHARQLVECGADCMSYRDVHYDSVSLGGHPALVARALGSGGQPDYHDEPFFFIRLFLQRDTVAYVRGSYGDARDLAELLAITSTITLR